MAEELQLICLERVRYDRRLHVSIAGSVCFFGMNAESMGCTAIVGIFRSSAPRLLGQRRLRASKTPFLRPIGKPILLSWQKWGHSGDASVVRNSS